MRLTNAQERAETNTATGRVGWYAPIGTTLPILAVLLALFLSSAFFSSAPSVLDPLLAYPFAGTVLLLATLIVLVVCIEGKPSDISPRTHSPEGETSERNDRETYFHRLVTNLPG